MSVRIEEEPMSRLDAHGGVPIAFLVERILTVSVIDGGLGGITLAELNVDSPWVKDYDAIKGEGPTRWPKRFDTSNWGLIAAYEDEIRIGGAVVAFNSPGLEMLDGRRDLACLWDLRVQPDSRSTGVGATVFRAVEGWSRRRGCRTLKVETQNINFPACRFYARMGCSLGAINRFAYPGLPEETQLLWFKELG